MCQLKNSNKIDSVIIGRNFISPVSADVRWWTHNKDQDIDNHLTLNIELIVDNVIQSFSYESIYSSIFTWKWRFDYGTRIYALAISSICYSKLVLLLDSEMAPCTSHNTSHILWVLFVLFLRIIFFMWISFTQIHSTNNKHSVEANGCSECIVEKKSRNIPKYISGRGHCYRYAVCV